MQSSPGDSDVLRCLREERTSEASRTERPFPGLKEIAKWSWSGFLSHRVTLRSSSGSGIIKTRPEVKNDICEEEPGGQNRNHS